VSNILLSTKSSKKAMFFMNDRVNEYIQAWIGKADNDMMKIVEVSV